MNSILGCPSKYSRTKPSLTATVVTRTLHFGLTAMKNPSSSQAWCYVGRLLIAFMLTADMDGFRGINHLEKALRDSIP